ncbi:DUF808 family protein [Mucilaginibacter lappiensis]|uniref:DUF808 family protein n=1 Tax=Mucilaginibacter lappiensis TaxID=354630 RepID=UPI003D1E63BB
MLFRNAVINGSGMSTLIVRMDDTGFKLIKNPGNKGFYAGFGGLLVKSLPVIITALSIIGTIALLLVSGGIFRHNIAWLHQLYPALPAIIMEFALGLAAGLIAVGLWKGGRKVSC